jgi:hypothetical protein
MMALARIPRVSRSSHAIASQVATFSSGRRVEQQGQEAKLSTTGGNGRIKSRRTSPSHRRSREVEGKRQTNETAHEHVHSAAAPFRAIALHPKDAHLHMALTPAHMPLKLNLGANHLDTDPTIFSLPSHFYSLKELLAYPSPVKPDLFFDKKDTQAKENLFRELFIVNGHISKLGAEREGFSDVLSEHQSWSGSFDAHKLRSSTVASSSKQHRSEATRHTDPANTFISSFLPQPSSADIEYSNVLAMIDSAKQRLSPTGTSSTRSQLGTFVPEDPHTALMMHEQAVRAQADLQRSDIDRAVVEVEDLLSRIDLSGLGSTSAKVDRSTSRKTAFIRAEDATSTLVNVRERGLTFGRWSDPAMRTNMMLNSEESVAGDFMWMDSVKRKRKKKISKHK